MTTGSPAQNQPGATVQVPAEDLRPGDQVMSDSGALDYKVHAAETAQERVQVADTRGGVHTYRAAETLSVRRS